MRSIDCVDERDGDVVLCQFLIGDRVWVRDPTRRCDKKSRIGTVTRVNSVQNVEVDGLPRHVRDLKLVNITGRNEVARTARENNEDDDDCYIVTVDESTSRTRPTRADQNAADSATEQPSENVPPLLRRSTRIRRPDTCSCEHS